jgi:hypothetical protein
LSTLCCFSGSWRTGLGEESVGRGPARADRAVLVEHQPVRARRGSDGLHMTRAVRGRRRSWLLI